MLHGCDRSEVLEERAAVGEPWPAIGHVVGEEEVETLEDAHQRRDARSWSCVSVCFQALALMRSQVLAETPTERQRHRSDATLR